MRSRIQTQRTVSLVLSLAGLLMLTLTVTVPQLITGVDPLATNTAAVFSPPSAAHPFGTDQTGRDVFSRVIYGARTTVLSAVIAAAAAALVGAAWGVMLAFLPRSLRQLGARVLDAAMALPDFLIALLIMAYTGPGAVGVTLAVALATMPGYARIALLQARSAITSEAHQTARVLGIGKLRRAFVYVLPETLRPIIAVAVLGVGFAVLMIAALTFLGLGLTPPDPDWGAMLSQGKLFVNRGWWAIVFPGLALLGTVALFTVLGKKLEARWS
ncbi:ABC transporter permease [Leucobacter sp. OH2974_COT-288]|nr:ABC transporter permease [Leucobacter sp. OH2974_COT-288]